MIFFSQKPFFSHEEKASHGTRSRRGGEKNQTNTQNTTKRSLLLTNSVKVGRENVDRALPVRGRVEKKWKRNF
jgi:hypothetical protein